MATVTRLDMARAFDPAGYLARNPDLQLAVDSGEVTDLWTHFDRHGYREGRQFLDFDTEFYLRSYPQVALDIQAGVVGSAFQHFLIYGRGCGFLPNAKAQRPDHVAACPSRFGGLWIDSLDAHARIDGRQETSQISPRQATLLRQFVRDGYVVLQGAIDAERLAAATAVFDAAYAGTFERLLFDCPAVSQGRHAPWQAEMNRHPAKALDIHFFGRALRELIFAPVVTEFLGLIFEAKAYASQTLGFLLGSAQEGHQDSAYVPYTLGRHFAASWIALEDVTIGAGELFYYVGSHRLPDFLYDGRFKSVSESQRMIPGTDVHAQTRAHVASLETLARDYGLRKEVFAAKKGDVLIWHADLVHGGNPVSQDITRKSVVTHYCPKYLVPLFGERQALRVHEHRGHLFTSSYCGQMDPLD